MISSKITSKIGFCILSLSLVLASCTNSVELKEGDSSRDNGLSDPNSIILDDNSDDDINDIFKRLRKEKPTTFFETWDYNSEENTITVDINKNKEAALAMHNHKLWLGFEEHIAKENTKTLKYISTSPFSLMNEEGVYNQKLFVNGKAYTGVLIGIHKSSAKKILEVNFYEGSRVGTFNVWTNLGRLYTKKIDSKSIIKINSTAVRKPIVYLYPTQEQKIDFKVNFNGKITHSYPKYDTNKGWSVSAKPNGEITDLTTNKTYPYLFWEGDSPYLYNLNSGFVVEGKNTADFLDQALADLGLNRTETTDFVSYWLPELEQNAYNHIHFSTEEYAQNAPLEITPAPETLIRVFMVYKPLAAPMYVPTQKLEKIERKGFTVVEWGGKKATQIVPAS